MNVPEYYSLFEPTYSEELAGEQIYVIKYKAIPSTRNDKTTYSNKILKILSDLGFSVLCKLENIHGGKSLKLDIINRSSEEIFFILDEKEVMAKVKRVKGAKDHTITFYYNIDKGSLDEQIDISEINKFRTKKKKTNISLIKSQGGGYLDIEEYELNVPQMDLEMNYGSEFKKIHDTIIKRLNTKDDKGIVLLHGEPGTGKTTYIKYLTTLVKNKEVIFVPPMMAESLTDPSIIPFLMDYKNSILIIEDAEKVLGSREQGSTSQSTSNLLNLTDGILGDCLNIQIVATFNTKRENIDSAFMRKGRLIAEHKFTKLSVEDSNKLLKHIGKDVTVDESMAVSDIYNIDVDVYKTIKEKNKIGF